MSKRRQKKQQKKWYQHGTVMIIPILVLVLGIGIFTGLALGTDVIFQNSRNGNKIDDSALQYLYPDDNTTSTFDNMTDNVTDNMTDWTNAPAGTNPPDPPYVEPTENVTG